MTLNHRKDKVLPKLGELLVCHPQRGPHLVEECGLLVLWQERQVIAHLSERHRTLHLGHRSVGLVKQRLGIGYESVGKGTHCATPFAARLPPNRLRATTHHPLVVTPIVARTVVPSSSLALSVHGGIY
jgi:hypothetical protein